MKLFMTMMFFLMPTLGLAEPTEKNVEQQGASSVWSVTKGLLGNIEPAEKDAKKQSIPPTLDANDFEITFKLLPGSKGEYILSPTDLYGLKPEEGSFVLHTAMPAQIATSSTTTNILLEAQNAQTNILKTLVERISQLEKRLEALEESKKTSADKK